ncbi:substrate-binding domain-containing protein [Streptomyces sp. Isolate_45]|uniref:substrate-binding domain-containing protein n=1 Tax=Streptomyces sp. Isolate_45 TaxID=2950111 RepID=UPI002481E657|nr:substrate-binding domain-containing protein [Streptomyces sp. Isolate_45]MDA5282523.1 substrate-binding domain-containing protein [Streptomyces sp. Isolate_45]
MSISADERRTRILEEVQKLGTVRVVELAERIGLPAVTVRRDAAALAEAGLVRRSHGSVSTVTGSADRAADGPTVGLLVPAAGQYFAEVIAGARAAVAEAGAQLVLGISSYEASADRVQIEQLLKSGVQGLLLAPNWTPADHPGDQTWVGELPVPAVLVERRPRPGSPAAELDSVSSDHRHGVLLALRHLSASGHDRVALAARRDTWTAHEIRVGYAEGCELLGLTAEPVIDILNPGADAEAVAGQLAAAVARGVRAVLVHNDQDAIQVLPLLRARGLRVPEDLAVVSYDDVLAALGAPPLTAVAPPKQAVGAEAVALLLRRIAAADSLPVHHVQLLPTLKVRESCGAAAG